MLLPLKRTDLQYDLPRDQIARSPVRPRDQARMLVVHRSSGRIEHRLVADILDYLQRGDLMCTNNSAVLPARVEGARSDSGGRVEGLVLDAGRVPWRMMLRSNGTLRIGQSIELAGPGDATGSIELVDRDEAHWLAVPASGTTLESIGHTPVPPYILKARGTESIPDQQDRDWYRTVYEDQAQQGSVAAPTAGFHFTPQLLDRLAEEGIERSNVTLHVGAGTFSPITTESVLDHRMHQETWSIETDALGAISARRPGPDTESPGRIMAVGTTTVRVLESLPDPLSAGKQLHGVTDLMIAPGHTFRNVDILMTNFHLPESTLLALVAAFIGLEAVKTVYAEAVREGYRFYSYGDAMLIL